MTRKPANPHEEGALLVGAVVGGFSFVVQGGVTSLDRGVSASITEIAVSVLLGVVAALAYLAIRK